MSKSAPIKINITNCYIMLRNENGNDMNAIVFGELLYYYWLIENPNA